jgi:hypothetical protein
MSSACRWFGQRAAGLARILPAANEGSAKGRRIFASPLRLADKWREDRITKRILQFFAQRIQEVHTPSVQWGQGC